MILDDYHVRRTWKNIPFIILEFMGITQLILTIMAYRELKKELQDIESEKH